MKELKVAVSITGRIAVLERFPDDEEHAGLHEMLLEFESAGIETDDSPGLYMATFFVDQTNPYDPSDVEAYLEISKMETIPDYFARIIAEPEPIQMDETEFLASIGLADNATNVIDMNSVRSIKQADENIQHAVSAWQSMTPEQQKEFDLKYRRDAAKADPTISVDENSDWDSKNIYLTTTYGPGKVKMIIGLHAIGHAGPYSYTLVNLDKTEQTIHTNFMVMEAWGNEYDEEHNMLGRGSFRLNTNDIEAVAKDYEAEGWTRCEAPKRPAQ